MKRRGRARKRPLNRFGVFRAFSPARFIFTYYLRFSVCGFTLVFTCFLAHYPASPCAEVFVLKILTFPRQIAGPLQNTVRKTLRISPLLTIRNDFFLSSTARFSAVFCILLKSSLFPKLHYTTSFQIPSAPLPAAFRHKRSTVPLLWNTVFLPYFPLLKLLFRSAMVA